MIALGLLTLPINFLIVFPITKARMILKVFSFTSEERGRMKYILHTLATSFTAYIAYL